MCFPLERVAETAIWRQFRAIFTLHTPAGNGISACAGRSLRPGEDSIVMLLSVFSPRGDPMASGGQSMLPEIAAGSLTSIFRAA
ncbi:hypothetical protein AWC15_00510 [Mycobacterium lacus]|nr:hypothetical protein AWC15_00510 [Mycobacterium lacus]